MVEAATSYKIISIFEIILVSLLGAAVPFIYIHHVQQKNGRDDRSALNNRPIFFMLKALTCGVIIGVALVHLAPDADENLGEQYEYPVTFVMMGVGVIVNLICEQVALYIINSSTGDDVFNPKMTDIASIEVTTTPIVSDIVENSDGSSQSTSIDENLQQAGRRRSVSDPRSRMESCEVGAVVAVFANANDPRALLKAYVLEGAIAVHSIIMGISLGSMQNDELTNIKILMIAYAVHQFLEGISLGCAMSSTTLSTSKIVGLVVFFACTLPFGVVVGIIITYSIDDSHSQEMVEGYANALAAGILVYVSMVEMLAEEFSNAVVKDDYPLKCKMIISVSLGFFSMCILAVWA